MIQMLPWSVLETSRGLANSVALDVVCSFLTDRAAASNSLKRVEKIEDNAKRAWVRRPESREGC